MDVSEVAQLLALVCALVLVCVVAVVVPFRRRARTQAGHLSGPSGFWVPTTSVWEAPVLPPAPPIQSDFERGALPQDLEDVRVRVTRAFARLEQRTEARVSRDQATRSMAETAHDAGTTEIR